MRPPDIRHWREPLQQDAVPHEDAVPSPPGTSAASNATSAIHAQAFRDMWSN